MFENSYTSISGKYIRQEEESRSIQAAQRIEAMMNDYLSLAHELAGNEELRVFLQGDPVPGDQNVPTEAIERFFLYKRGEEEIHIISVQVDKYLSTGYIPNLYLYKNWGILYDLSRSPEDHLFFSSLYRGISGDTINLSVAVKIYDEKRQVIGYVIIDVYRNRIRNIFPQDQNSSSRIILTNSDNYVVYSGTDRYEEGTQYLPIEQSAYAYTFSRPLLNHTFYLQYEVRNTFLLDVKERFRTRVYLLIVVSIIASMMIALIISSGLRKPINKLIQTMKIVGKGNLDAQIDLKKRDDLHELQEEFNKLVRKLKQLQEENIENVQLLHQAQIDFLQAQIKPHFLYNMLATIKGMVSCSSPEEVKAAIVTLTKLLRNSFDFSDELRSLEDHLSIIRCYVDMQNYRFSNRFSLTVDAHTESLGCRMPPLLLQPIVENSIIHGFANQEKDCEIRIIAETAGDYLFITITDNGVGISSEILNNIHKSALSEQTSHIGLSNVIRRIKFFYDDTCYIRVESRAMKGTKVVFKLLKL
jgi:two-component system sensor histidine kinase YesM